MNLQLYLFVLGAIFGSFFNVLILRYEPGGAVFGKQLGGRSKCPKCGKVLHWYELVPVFSFIVQLGRCRGCKGTIAIQYPIVELLCGIILATFPAMMGFTAYSFVLAAALLLLVVASFIDIRHYVIPDILTVIIAGLGIGATAMISSGLSGTNELIPGTFLGGYAYVFSFTQNVWMGHLFAALAGGIFFSSIILLTKGKAMGWGDAKLAAAIGFLLGWPDAILALMIAFIVGAFAGIGFLVTKKKDLKDALPFGPFIALGTVAVLYFGYDMMSLYFKFLNLGV
jgi:leader peptidase (prepilin peptidase)/N-methyltransferase